MSDSNNSTGVHYHPNAVYSVDLKSISKYIANYWLYKTRTDDSFALFLHDNRLIKAPGKLDAFMNSEYVNTML